MASHEPDGDGFERPILEGGERLSEVVEDVRGGGPKYHPRSREEAREMLQPQVEQLEKSVASLPEEMRGNRVTFESTLLPNYLAGSYFPAGLLNDLGLHYVGSRNARAPYETRARSEEEYPTKNLLLSGADAAISALSELVHEEITPATYRLWDELREIHQIGLEDASQLVQRVPEELEEGDIITWEVVLHKVAGESEREIEAEKDQIFGKLQSLVERLGGEIAIEYRRVVAGMTFVPVSLPIGRAVEAAAFNPLRALRPMPKLRPTPISILRTIEGAEPPSPLDPDEYDVSQAEVAVFDGGIDPDDSYAGAFTRQYDVSPEPPDAECREHGSAVTNAILYGYVGEGDSLARPYSLVDHYRVLPSPSQGALDIELNWILDRVVEAVRENSYRIVNLSIGPNVSVTEDDEPHRWTSELDQLARDEDVLFVCAAGNNGEADSALKLDRVQVPADMVNGVGVGACSARTGEWERSPYSAVGPGRWGGRVKPTGLAFGGSEEEPYTALGSNGIPKRSRGTSFATPLVTRGLGELLSRFDGDLTPHLLRAFCIQFSGGRDEHDLAEHGFGRLPEAYQERLECEQNEITVVYEGQLPREGMVSFLIPVPDDLPESLMVGMEWTLCFTSPVSPSETTDYTSAGLETTFRPHANRYTIRDGDKSLGVVDVEEEVEKFFRLIGQGGAPSTYPVSESRGRVRHTEQKRREAGKWETTVRRRLQKRSSSVFRPTLDVTYLAREGGELIRDGVPPLDYALLATVRVRSNVDLYSRVRNQFDVLTPITTRLRVRT